jgi:hypothetical protein
MTEHTAENDAAPIWCLVCNTSSEGGTYLAFITEHAGHDDAAYAAGYAAGKAEVVRGVRAWCAINEIAAPPLDWEGLGEFLTRVTAPGVTP